MFYLYLGLLIGLMAGFGLIWWLAGRNQSPEPFFARLLQAEISSSRLRRRLALHELERKVEELSARMEKLNLDIHNLQKASGEWFSVAAQPELTEGEADVPNADSLNSLKGLHRCREIYRLFQEGLPPGEIARQLKIGRGEVELILSLNKKPSWVIEKKELKEIDNSR